MHAHTRTSAPIHTHTRVHVCEKMTNKTTEQPLPLHTQSKEESLDVCFRDHSSIRTPSSLARYKLKVNVIGCVTAPACVIVCCVRLWHLICCSSCNILSSLCILRTEWRQNQSLVLLPCLSLSLPTHSMFNQKAIMTLQLLLHLLLLMSWSRCTDGRKSEITMSVR